MKPVAILFLIAALVASCGERDNRSRVAIETEFGTMEVVLYEETPRHRDNFLKLAREGFYDSLLFHRIVPNFMIQGGDPASRHAGPNQMLGEGGPGYLLEAEFAEGVFHKKGALAAARQGDAVNPEKKSNGSQFYIVQGKPISEQELLAIEQKLGKSYAPEVREHYLQHGGAPFLDGDYTVFGEVVEGMEIIDKIAAQPTGMMNRPRKDIRMEVRVLKE